MTPRRVSSLINRLVIVVDRYAVEAYQNRGQIDQEVDPRQDPRMQAPTPGSTSSKFGNFDMPGYDRGPNGLWFPIMSTAVYDPNGNSTIIEFSNLRVNLGISEMSFNFMMPAGVQVVRPTGKEMGF